MPLIRLDLYYFDYWGLPLKCFKYLLKIIAVLSCYIIIFSSLILKIGLKNVCEGMGKERWWKYFEWVDYYKVQFLWDINPSSQSLMFRGGNGVGLASHSKVLLRILLPLAFNRLKLGFNSEIGSSLRPQCDCSWNTMLLPHCPGFRLQWGSWFSWTIQHSTCMMINLEIQRLEGERWGVNAFLPEFYLCRCSRFPGNVTEPAFSQLPGFHHPVLSGSHYKASECDGFADVCVFL